MIATPNKDFRRLFVRSVSTAKARDRLTKALYEATVDGLDFGPRDLARADDREWIHGHIAVSLQEATDAALEVLASSLCSALERGPNGLLDRFVKSHHLEDLGFE